MTVPSPDIHPYTDVEDDDTAPVCTPRQSGEFAFGGNGYVGFTIDAGDGLRYGWVELSWNAIFKLLTIEGFAYETQVGASINAGEGIPAPGALGLFGLAAGAAGIRRKRKL